MWGIRFGVPGWFSVETGWSAWPPAMERPSSVLDTVQAMRTAHGSTYQWGYHYIRTFSVGRWEYCASFRSRISDEEARRRRLPGY